MLATRTALHLADWVITEAGFGFDLGAEKFFHIKCRSAGLDPHMVVLVASVRALKLHGGARLASLDTPDAEAVARGYLYEPSEPVPDKIRAIATAMYGADSVVYTKAASRDLHDIERLGYADLPVCIAKTPSSLSDDPRLMGRPRDFDTVVRRIQINAGAGFLVVLTGDIMRMLGLSRKPRAESIDIDSNGTIHGLQ